MVIAYRFTQRLSARSRRARTGSCRAPSIRATMSVSVGAFSSKSRRITAANCSSDWKTEKSSSGKKLNGKTMRP
jgi:hypothetical protein